MTSRLEIEGVACRAGAVTILEGVDLRVAAGELVALLGRNGAGKSTLIDVVAGLRRPAAGRLRLDGRPLADLDALERARLVCHLPQAVRPDLAFTARQLVLMGRYPHADRWFESDADRSAVASALRRTGAEPFADRRLSTLSGGERQRVLLAACLAQSARLLLLDEPSTFLDVDQQLHCFELLREEALRGAACIAVTHDLNLALAFCSRLVVLADRRVAFDGTAARARESADWLSLFSPRLRLRRGPSGPPWVTVA